MKLLDLIGVYWGAGFAAFDFVHKNWIFGALMVAIFAVDLIDYAKR